MLSVADLYDVELGSRPPYCWSFQLTHNYTHIHTR